MKVVEQALERVLFRARDPKRDRLSLDIRHGSLVLRLEEVHELACVRNRNIFLIVVAAVEGLVQQRGKLESPVAGMVVQALATYASAARAHLELPLVAPLVLMFTNQ